MLYILFMSPSAFLYAQEKKITSTETSIKLAAWQVPDKNVAVPEQKDIPKEKDNGKPKKDEEVKTGWNFNIFLGGGQASSKSNDDNDKADSLTQEKPSSARNQLIPAGELNIRTGSDRMQRLPYAPVYSLQLGGIGPFELGYSYIYQDYDDRDLEEVRTDIYGAPVTDSERSDLKRTGAVTDYSISTGLPVYQQEEEKSMVLILGGYNVQEYNASGKSEAYKHPGYNLGVRTAFSPFSLMLQYMWGVRQYEKENPVFRKKRKDAATTQMMMAEYELNSTFSLAVRVIQNNVDSNINFYDAESQIVMAGVSMTF
ncbi:hypothetical protein CHS0354_026817 [Potamilus streckersoni]|uniref:Uncharacterized protein n=1 Tax=Potamilus streckersoni TaxID=2493646 RepID=A0AAE0T5K8_9BIVA|nr:hypothetical protein CHS0354_026817 [Potamilus streckersoni]